MSDTYTVRRDATVRTIRVDINRSFEDVLLDSEGGAFIPRWGTVRVLDDEIRADFSGPMVKRNGDVGERLREVAYSNHGYSRNPLATAPQWVRDLVAEVTQ